MTRARALGCVLLALLLGTSAWWLLRGSGVRPGPNGGVPSAPSEARPPELVGTGVARPVAPGSPPAAESRPAQEPAGEARREAADPHLLDGELVGFVPAGEAKARIVVTGVTVEYEPVPAHAETTAGPDGHFSLDVTPIFGAGTTIVELHVRADHPDYVPAEARVPVTSSAEARARRYHVRIPLERAGVLSGRVETARGDPAKTTVAAFRMDGGKPTTDAACAAESDAEGRYRLRVGKAASYLVVAAGSELGTPAQALVDAAPGSHVEVPTLVLGEGVGIRGVARDLTAPLAGASVEAHPDREGAVHLSVGGTDIDWRPHLPAMSGATARTDVRGRFDLTGLAPGPYRLRVAHAAGFTVHVDAAFDSEVVVEAPTTDARLTLHGCLVTLAVVRDGRPVPRSALTVMGTSGCVSLVADAAGEARLLLPAGDEIQVTSADASGAFEPWTFTAPTDRPETREVIDLSTHGGRAAVVVTLGGAGASSVAGAGVAFFSSDTDSWPAETYDLQAEEGRLRVEGAPAGRFVLRVRPGGPWWGGHGLYREESVEVEVPSHGEIDVGVTLHPAGRLRVAARDPDGDFLEAGCEVHDARGERVPVVFVQRTPGGWSATDGTLESDAISSVDPALAPGTYEVRFAMHGYEEKVVSVDVVAGESRDVEVTLEPAR